MTQLFLVQLSYTAAAWEQQLRAAGQSSATGRLAAVNRLLTQLDGAFVKITLPGAGGRPGEPGGRQMDGKFIGIAEHDVHALVTLPDHASAFALTMAFRAEPGISAATLTPLQHFDDAIVTMARAHTARMAAGYAAPGGGSAEWTQRPTTE